MGLTLTSIRLSGFGSYGPTEQIVRFGGSGPVAVVGDNGAGKSTAVSKALTWCLYGKCAPERMGSGMRAISGKSVVNPACKTATVTVTFEGSTYSPEHGPDGYVITRSRKKTGSDSLTVTQSKGGEDTTLEPTEATIQSIVGADWFVFTRTVVRGQGDLWSFAEATDKAKRELLDIVSGAFVLEAFESRAAQARKAADNRADRACLLAETAENRLKGRQPEVLKAKAEAWEGDNSERISAAETDLAAAVTDEEAAKTELKDIAGRKSAYAALLRGKPSLDRQPYVAAVEEAQRLYDSANKAVIRAQADYDSVIGLTEGSDCPTCGQEVGPSAPIVQHQKAAAKQLQKTEKTSVKPKKFLDECLDTLAAGDSWLSTTTEAWQQDLADFGPMVRPRYDDAVRYRKSVAQRLETLQTSPNPFIVAYEKETRDVLDLAKSAQGYRAVQAEATREATIADLWAKALSSKGARAHMAEAALATIEAEANEWLTILSDGNLTVEFPATREVKGAVKEDIKTIITGRLPGGSMGSRDLLTFSGGERRRINLAVDLGVASVFSKGGLTLSLLVLDEEVFSGMDEAGKAGVVHSLHGAGIADVVIIDHDPRLSSTLPRTLKVRRGADGHSIIEEVGS